MNLPIIYTDTITGTPAAVDRAGGVIYINPRLFDQLTPFEQKFVLLHEEGHYALDTSDEVACDAYAFDRMAGTEFQSLKQMIATLDHLLVVGNNTRENRLFELYIRVLQWDAANGNKEAERELISIQNEPLLNSFSGDAITNILTVGSFLTLKNLIIALVIIFFIYLIITL